MIEINRDDVERPDVLDLDDETSLAAKETKKAIAHAEDPTQPKPKFEVYSHDKVKVALIKLCRGKCAYCESKVNAVSARDIEHFRPKGQVDPDTGEEPFKPGYYWLAAQWENLLLSCPACNQRRRQLVRNEAGDFEFADESTGKLDSFPLRDETRRVRSHDDDIDDEEPARLLLNPCIDNPSKHLRFDDEGQILARSIHGEVSDMATESIRVFALNRTVLNEERKTLYLDMVKIWEDIELADQMIAMLDDNAKPLIRAQIQKKKGELLAMIEPDQPYSAVADWMEARVFRRRIRAVEERFEARFGEPV